MMALSDLTSMQNFARDEGLVEGLEQGRAEGRAEGSEEAMKTVARNLLAKGSSVEYVHEITGLAFEMIKDILNDH
jgi:predicted transposase/invertase (TIGR01784 family)